MAHCRSLNITIVSSVEALLLQFIEDAPDAVVDLADHVGVQPTPRGEFPNSGDTSFDVGHVGGDGQEERSSRCSPNEPDRTIGEAPPWCFGSNRPDLR